MRPRVKDRHATPIVGAIGREIDDFASPIDIVCANQRMGEGNGTADRVGPERKARSGEQRLGEGTSTLCAVNNSPRDNDFLRVGTPPLHISDGNAPEIASGNCVQNVRMGDGRGIALALEQDLRVVDRARCVGQEYEFEVNCVIGRRRIGEAENER